MRERERDIKERNNDSDRQIEGKKTDKVPKRERVRERNCECMCDRVRDRVCVCLREREKRDRYHRGEDE